MSAPPPIPRAPAVAAKLEVARAVRAALAPDVAMAALETAEGVRGACQRLADMRARVAAADREIGDLEKAHVFALQIDADADAQREAAGREKLFGEFRAVADKWLEKGKELAAAIEAAARLRVEFGYLTEKLELALPTGVIPHPVNFRLLDSMIDGSVFPAHIDVLLAGEAYKHGALHAYLPGATPPVLSQTNNPAAIEPAAQAFQRARNYFCRLLRDRFDEMKPVTRDAA